jgi:hypothetical protein
MDYEWQDTDTLLMDSVSVLRGTVQLVWFHRPSFAEDDIPASVWQGYPAVGCAANVNTATRHSRMDGWKREDMDRIKGLQEDGEREQP